MVDITHQHSTHRSTQCTHLHSSLQRQSVFVFASRFLDPKCDTDRVLIWLKKKNRFTDEGVFGGTSFSFFLTRFFFDEAVFCFFGAGDVF